MRAPTEILLEFRSGVPEGQWPLSKSLGGDDVRYRIESKGFGSNGEERLLSAWKSATDGYVALDQTVQSEQPSEADFQLGWDLLASARVEK